MLDGHLEVSGMVYSSDYQIMVSIFCLSYNHEKYIRKALEGFVMQQTKYSFEVVIHDDASTDGSVKIIEEYEKNYPHIIKPIYETKNLYSQGINFFKLCLEKYCRGKYIAFCEGDDYWTDPNKLETQISFMEQHPEFTLTYHSVNYVVDDTIIGNDVTFNQEREVSTDEIIRGGGYFCASPSLVFTRALGIDYPRFRLMAEVADYPLQILAAVRGKVYYFPQIMGCYRKNHPGAWSTLFHQAPSDRVIAYINNEIEWLKELDRETEGKYSDSITYKIVLFKFTLYDLKHLERTEVENSIALIKNVKFKEELVNRFRRVVLRNRFPFLATIYRIVRYKLLGRLRQN